MGETRGFSAYVPPWNICNVPMSNGININDLDGTRLQNGSVKLWLSRTLSEHGQALSSRSFQASQLRPLLHHTAGFRYYDCRRARLQGCPKKGTGLKYCLLCQTRTNWREGPNGVLWQLSLQAYDHFGNGLPFPFRAAIFASRRFLPLICILDFCRGKWKMETGRRKDISTQKEFKKFLSPGDECQMDWVGETRGS